MEIYSTKAAANKNRRKSNLDGDIVDANDESLLDVYHQNISADIDRLAHEFSTLHEKCLEPEIPDTVDTFVRIIELRIKRYNSTKPGMRCGKMVTDQEDQYFTDAITRLSKLKIVLSEFPNTTPSLDRITDVLQQAMTLMQDEFQALLLDYTAPSEPITICKKPNSCTSLEPDNNQQDFPGYSKDNMILMQKIVAVMIHAGYQYECCQVYSTVRRDALHEQVKRFGFEKVNVEDVHKSKWASLEPDISRWVNLANYSSDVLFPAERKLGETVFSNHISVFTGLFINLIHGVTALLVDFATAVAMTKPKAKRLFKFLDIYEALGGIGRALVDESNSHVKLEEYCNLQSEISSVRGSMGETVVIIFNDLNNSIRNDTNKTPVQGGAVHPLTRYVMNYLKCAFDEYKDTLEHILRQHVHEASSQVVEDKSSLSKQLFSVIELLDANLEVKSGLYKDPSLRCIFLMNNNRFILQVVKGNKEMKEAMGDNWCRRKSSDVRNYHTSYQRETWNKLLQCITQEGVQVNGKPNRRIVKEKLKNFNGMFDEIYKTQSTWVVNDEQLLSEIRVSITAVVSPAYRSFIGRYGEGRESNEWHTSSINREANSGSL
ncbi:Cullin repeat-like-containing domain-containing protein [Cynara cardunculus var. scolymus]|uniref:Exocyst subunit Exo70 family protein n=1 Tax=Cynara cardunculus var. scolymus TaxID=59895 RepID=A0A103YAV4_CYNCS|nr:Cullin repeat-like-containing domain-containing protein [Cynara cardunculus var. scolymus]